MAKWSEAQEWEASWWGDCLNTYGEEEKQILYARYMGLSFFHNKKSPYNIDLAGASVIDIGGGPASILLKCVNRGRARVVDPLVVPDWVGERYWSAGIEFKKSPGEKLDKLPDPFGWNEAWIYNCLQHTKDPNKVIKNALRSAGIVRVFEWINTSINAGHPHAFTAEKLDRMLGGEGKVVELRGQANCHGNAYYGIFVGTGLD